MIRSCKKYVFSSTYPESRVSIHYDADNTKTMYRSACEIILKSTPSFADAVIETTDLYCVILNVTILGHFPPFWVLPYSLCHKLDPILVIIYESFFSGHCLRKSYLKLI